MRCPICGSQLAKTIYIPPEDSGKQYVNYLCAECRIRFRYAKVKRLVIGDGRLSFKLENEEVIYNSWLIYFIRSKIAIQKNGGHFKLTAFGESMMLRKFRNPPFPLSELR